MFLIEHRTDLSIANFEPNSAIIILNSSRKFFSKNCI